MPRKIPLPRGWNRRTKAAILQILALSHYAFKALVATANERSWSPAGTADPCTAHVAQYPRTTGSGES